MLDVNGKAMGPDRNEKLRALVRKLVDAEFQGNKSAAAKAFGVSQSYVQEFLGGTRGAGTKFMLGIAAYTGTSVDDLMGVRQKSTSNGIATFPRWGSLPGWTEALADARKRYGNRIPAVAFDHAGDFMGMDIPAEIDARTVYNAAKLWWESRSEDQQSEAIAAQARAEMAAEDAEAMDLLKRGELRDEIAELKRQADSAKGKLKADAPVKPRKT